MLIHTKLSMHRKASHKKQTKQTHPTTKEAQSRQRTKTTPQDSRLATIMTSIDKSKRGKDRTLTIAPLTTKAL